MSIQIRIDGGYQIEKAMFFGYSYAHNGLINLASDIGEDMKYQHSDITIIEYPGEYDIKGRSIKAIRGENSKLNYLIQKGNKSFGIIQSPDVLELDDVDGMSAWLYLGENIEKKMDQLEMEGERINLAELEKKE